MLQELFDKLNGCFDTFLPRENLSSKEYIVADCIILHHNKCALMKKENKKRKEIQH